MALAQAVAGKSGRANPGLADLAGLVGDWEVEIWNASFLPSPKERVSGGRVQFEWIEDGALLAMRQLGDSDGPPASRWIIGRDQASDEYAVCYSDNRGVSRIYSMSFKGTEWKLWRDNDEFAQRFHATLSGDGDVLTGQWEKSSKGGEWEHDFNLKYTRSR